MTDKHNFVQRFPKNYTSDSYCTNPHNIYPLLQARQKPLKSNAEAIIFVADLQTKDTRNELFLLAYNVQNRFV